jgi:hypothetical protein
MKCSEVLQCCDVWWSVAVLWCSFGFFFSYRCVRDCMFFILLFNSVIYVFLLLCMFRSVYSVFIVPAGTLRLPWLRFIRAFSSVVRQMPGYSSQRRGTVRTLLISVIVLFCVLFLSILLFYVFFVCKCVLYYCQRVSTQLQLNISYHILSYDKFITVIKSVTLGVALDLLNNPTSHFAGSGFKYLPLNRTSDLGLLRFSSNPPGISE